MRLDVLFQKLDAIDSTKANPVFTEAMRKPLPESLKKAHEKKNQETKQLPEQ
jgi:hypothetical protein